MTKITPTVKLDNVSMYYHDKNNVNVGISKITLEFYKGEFVAVTGESGSGKTSLLNVIGATLGYHDGEVYYDNEPSSHFDDEDRETFRRERIGYICQNYNLIDSYTLLQNVIASMIISGWNAKEAKVKALEYLDKVGLKELANKKASKISSGQKQRLGIARALAKETDIILADEPTGNLDSENACQIVDLLKELSKDHLVIMVTHNVDEAIGKATRIIRISDGHVVLDEQKSSDNVILPASKKILPTLETKKVAWIFSWFNRKAKPKRAILLSIFMLLVSIATFVFMGTIISNMDDTTTKVYDDKAFINKRLDRIVVMKDDKTAITKDDLNQFNNLKYVVESDQYDLVNDFNYYTLDDLQYRYYELMEYTEDGFPILETKEDHQVPEFSNYQKYMRSVTCLKEEDLISGTIPTNINEIVIYGTEEDLGKEIKIYLQQRNIWGELLFISYDMKVTGILKANKFVNNNQIYFSEMLCTEMIGNALKSFNNYISWFIKVSTVKEKEYQRKCFVFTDVIGENQVVLSHDFFNGELKKEFSGNIGINENKKREYHVKTVSEQMSNQIIKVDTSKHDYFFEDVVSNQATIYIEDYAYTDEVISAINNMGYLAINSYRVSALEYDAKLLNERNVTIIICVLAILFIFLLTLFVLSAFLSLNQGDYLLLRFIGMNKKTMYWTNFFEMLFTAVIMFISALVITLLLNNFKLTIINNIIKYMVWYQFIIIFIVVFLIVLATTYKFNVGLQKKTNSRVN